MIYEPNHQNNKRKNPTTSTQQNHLNRLTCLGSFGGCPRQFSGISANSQLLIADGEIALSVSIHRPRMDSFRFSSFCVLLFCAGFEPASLAHITKTAQIKLRQPQYLRTASTAEQSAISLAQSIKVRTEVRACRPEDDDASEHTRAKVLPRATLCPLLPPMLSLSFEYCYNATNNNFKTFSKYR